MDAFHKPGIQTAVISTAARRLPTVNENQASCGGGGKADPNLSVPFGAVRQVLRRDSRPKTSPSRIVRRVLGRSKRKVRGEKMFLSRRTKRKACAAQTGTRDVGDNCGEHNCRHSQVHISSESTDVNTQLTDTHEGQTSGPGLTIATRFHALVIPLRVKTHDPRRRLWFGLVFFLCSHE